MVKTRPKLKSSWNDNVTVASNALAGGMTSLTIISALLGVWLGLTFRVFILVPAAILALATLAGSGAANEAGAVWMIVLDTSIIAAMQAGYIGGSALFVAVAD
jgi:hypothetical protein